MIAKTYFTLHIPITENGLSMVVWFLLGVLIGMLAFILLNDSNARKLARRQHEANSKAWISHITNGGK